MKNLLKITLLLSLIALPVVSFAQLQPLGSEDSYPNTVSTGNSGSGSWNTINCSGLGDANAIVTCVKSLMVASIYILISFAVVFTIYGGVRFIGAEGDEREKWRQVMTYGIIALFVITSIWGLVGILSGTFGFSSAANQAPLPPAI